MTPSPTIDVRRAEDRLATRLPWLDSHHSFSFSRHYDPANTHHGLLLVSNDDVVRAGTGFSTHPHQDMEIVTWVLEGELEHNGSASGRGHDAAISIRQEGAVLWGGRLRPGETAAVPDARSAHLFVARGALTLDGAGRLEAGDAVRFTEAGAPSITADPADGAEVLIWELAS
ncbi:MAG TPA: pirin family protein [Acidimicrobiales bacterium]|nr:pirin family protein [Acidimicrobiales bacterium]